MNKNQDRNDVTSVINRKNSLLFLALAAALWSTGGVLIKYVTWSPLAIAGGRSLIAAVVIWFAFRHERLSFSKVEWAGALAYCATVIFFVTATKLTTAANAILLQYTAPVYVALLSGWLLSEKVTRRDWITTGCVVAGMLFFFIDKVSAGGMLGNIIAVASGVSFALLAVFARMQKEKGPFGSVLLGNLLTFAISIPFLPGSSLNEVDLSAMLFLGIFQLGLGYVMYTLAIRHVKALEATLITTIEPILNPLWVFLFLGEMPGFYSLIGGGIVLSAVVASYCFDHHRSDSNQPAAG